MSEKELPTHLAEIYDKCVEIRKLLNALKSIKDVCPSIMNAETVTPIMAFIYQKSAVIKE